MILELLAGILLGAQPADNRQTIVPSGFELRSSCREAWTGRKAWETLTLLRSDSDRHVWFLLMPQSTFIAPFPSAVGAWDYRGTRLVEFDGEKWWQYQIGWEQEPKELRWDLAESGQASGPFSMTARFYPRFRPAEGNAAPLYIRHFQVEADCLVETADPVQAPLLRAGFDKPQVERAAPGINLQQPDWELLSRRAYPYPDSYYTSDGSTTWMLYPEPAQDKDTFLYFFDGKTWEQRYRLPKPPHQLYPLNLLRDANDALWVSFGVNRLFMRYEKSRLCAWSAVSATEIGFGRLSADANGRVWVSGRSPSHGTFDLPWRFRELPHYERYRQDYPLENLFGQFDFLPGEGIDDFANQVFFEYSSQLVPLYFENETWHLAAVPPRESHVKWTDLEAMNKSKRCWPIDAVNWGRVELPAGML